MTTMTTMTTSTRSLTTVSVALAGALLLTSCGGGDDTARSDTGSSSHGGGHSASSAPSATTSTAAQGNDADVAFLTGMRPHHEQAVEMSDMVLAADPPAPVAEIARQVKAAQAPEIEQMDQMLADLGGHGGHGDGHAAGGHGGMMSDADMQALRDATGPDAARMYLESMIEHHRGAIEAAETEVADGRYPPAVELARTIAEQQAAEITQLEALVASL